MMDVGDGPMVETFDAHDGQGTGSRCWGEGAAPALLAVIAGGTAAVGRVASGTGGGGGGGGGGTQGVSSAGASSFAL